MPGHDIIVIGASAGGVDAMQNLVRDLPADLPAALFVVLHIPPESPSAMPGILSRVGALPAMHPEDHTRVEHGRIYVAPPDHHLLLEDDHVRVIRGPKENRHRPAIDPLFRSAAVAAGPRVVGVVLTGSLDDGTAGLRAIKQRGGTAIVQDPADALYPGMPRSALANVDVDYSLPLAGIPSLLASLAHEEAEDGRAYPVTAQMELETRIVQMEANTMESVEEIGEPSGFTCPECHGALWEVKDDKIIRFRCHVGHAYTIDSMLADQSEALERALWAALRALEERAAIARRLLKRARDQGHSHAAARFAASLTEVDEHADVIRQILLDNDSKAIAGG